MGAVLSPKLNRLVTEAWSQVSGASLEEAGRSVDEAGLVVTGKGGALPSSFAVEDLAVACVATALVAGSTLGGLRTAKGPVSGPGIEIDRDHVSLSVRSERYFRAGGRQGPLGFAPLSRFWRASDGWVRTHGNYPWHVAALLRALEARDDPESVASAIGSAAAAEVEDEVVASGGVAAMVRSQEQWEKHPQSTAVGAEPLVARASIGEAPPRSAPVQRGALPAQGLRVLDLTRVIAGPVCTRYLGALGAEVLRIDPPRRPDMEPGSLADTLVAKRSAFLDLHEEKALETLQNLLRDADVVVCGYRPGALERFGLDESSLAERQPGLVVVYLDAWGHSGAWAPRRGFDSIVQAACGIAVAESDGDGTPGALPCQLLDHGTGYLAAAAALEGVRARALTGATQVRRLSLARTARWLVSCAPPPGRPQPPVKQDPSRFVSHLGDAAGPGSLDLVSPPGALWGRALSWPERTTRYGKDTPDWEFRR